LGDSAIAEVTHQVVLAPLQQEMSEGGVAEASGTYHANYLSPANDFVEFFIAWNRLDTAASSSLFKKHFARFLSWNLSKA
jgi:hypothetical protein